jgi:RHS repeat-associated protein
MKIRYMIDVTNCPINDSFCGIVISRWYNTDMTFNAFLCKVPYHRRYYSFFHRSSPTGYNAYKLVINGIEVGSGSIFVSSGSTLQNTGTVNVSNPISNLSGNITVTLKLFGGQKGTQGTFRMDDFILNGFTQSTENAEIVGLRGYRYGYQGSEKDDEMKGSGNSYDFGARMYDSRVGRWLSLDHLAHTSPSLSPYNFVANCPVVLIDPDGKKEKPYEKGKSKPVQEVPNTQTPVHFYDPNGNPTGIHPNSDIAYNCHSFAWHNSEGDKNDEIGNNLPYAPKWDNNPKDDIKEQRAKQLHKDVRNKVGDKVIYYQDVNGDGIWQENEPIAHSALVKEIDREGNTVTVEGKMGESGMSVNHPGAPGYYETDNGNRLSRAYFRTNGNIQKLGNIEFDSNAIRKGENGELIAQDIKTGKDYGVTRDEKTGKYDFVRNKTKK